MCLRSRRCETGPRPPRLRCILAIVPVKSRLGERSPGHVAQHVWTSVSGNDLGRKPRPGDRLRHRRLPAGHPARGRRHPASSSTGEGPGSRASPRSAASPIACASSRASLPTSEGRQVTTGTPIALVIDNVDQRGKDYADIKDKFRPGHADFTYWAKYGIRDYRGGGRSSRRARRPCGSPPGRSRARSSPA